MVSKACATNQLGCDVEDKIIRDMHKAAFEVAKKLESGESEYLMKDVYSVKLLREMSAKMEPPICFWREGGKIAARVMPSHKAADKLHTMLRGQETRARKNSYNKELDAKAVESMSRCTPQFEALKNTIQWYLSAPWAEVEKYKVGNEALHAAKFIPCSFLHRKLAWMSCYRKDPKGATVALKRALNRMVELGWLAEIEPSVTDLRYNFKGLCYKPIGV